MDLHLPPLFDLDLLYQSQGYPPGEEGKIRPSGLWHIPGPQALQPAPPGPVLLKKFLKLPLCQAAGCPVPVEAGPHPAALLQRPGEGARPLLLSPA